MTESSPPGSAGSQAPHEAPTPSQPRCGGWGGYISTELADTEAVLPRNCSGTKDRRSGAPTTATATPQKKTTKPPPSPPPPLQEHNAINLYSTRQSWIPRRINRSPLPFSKQDWTGGGRRVVWRRGNVPRIVRVPRQRPTDRPTAALRPPLRLKTHRTTATGGGARRFRRGLSK